MQFFIDIGVRITNSQPSIDNVFFLNATRVRPTQTVRGDWLAQKLRTARCNIMQLLYTPALY